MSGTEDLDSLKRDVLVDSYFLHIYIYIYMCVCVCLSFIKFLYA